MCREDEHTQDADTQGARLGGTGTLSEPEQEVVTNGSQAPSWH